MVGEPEGELAVGAARGAVIACGEAQQNAVVQAGSPGQHDHSAGCRLRHQGVRHRVESAGGDDPVVRRVRGAAEGAVTGDDRGGVAGVLQVRPRDVGDTGGQLDGYHVPFAEPLREEGGVVAGARADLQRTLAVGQGSARKIGKVYRRSGARMPSRDSPCLSVRAVMSHRKRRFSTSSGAFSSLSTWHWS